MKSMHSRMAVRHGKIISGVAASMIAAGIIIVASTSQSVLGEGQGPCPQCTITWVTQANNGIGFECGHGPEHDNDCNLQNPDCCEHKPGGCTGAAGECSCYTCGLANGGCEPWIGYLDAYCGASGTGSCPHSTVEPYRTDIYKTKNMKLGNGVQACNHTAGFTQYVDCGGVTNNGGCLAPDGACVANGPWVYRKGNFNKACP